MDSLFIINNSYNIFFPQVENIGKQGRVSQNFDLGSCYFLIM